MRYLIVIYDGIKEFWKELFLFGERVDQGLIKLVQIN